MQINCQISDSFSLDIEVIQTIEKMINLGIATEAILYRGNTLDHSEYIALSLADRTIIGAENNKESKDYGALGTGSVLRI